MKIGTRTYRWFPPTRLPADAIRVFLWKRFPKFRKFIFVRQGLEVLNDWSEGSNK